MTHGLADAWQAAGARVRVVTATPLNGEDELTDLCVKRQPSSLRRLRLSDWADIVVRSGNSLRSLSWPVLTGTPAITIHHRPLSAEYGGRVRSIVERATSRFGWNVAVSSFVAETIPGSVVRIPNSFRPIFDQVGEGDGNREGVLFVGRLVDRKGVDVALSALQMLRGKGIDESLTVCGDGPERERLEQKSRHLGVSKEVNFIGWTGRERLAELYSRSKVVIIPSRKEPFGIVALEAIASGCPVVASDVGGLPEAVGECGVLVEPDQPEALAEGIETVLQPVTRRSLREAMPAHVERHRIDRIADEYLRLFESVLRDASG